MNFGPPNEDYVVLAWGRLAYLINGALQIILIPVGFPVALLTLPMTFVGGCLTALTLGLLGFVFIILWMPIALILMGTSWAYKNLWPLRPIVVLIGFPFAILGFIFASWMPSYGDRFAREHRIKMATWWPLSLELEDPAWPIHDDTEEGADEQERQEDEWGKGDEILYGYTAHGRRAHLLEMPSVYLAYCGVGCDRRSGPGETNEMQVCKVCTAAADAEAISGDVEEGEEDMPEWKRKLMELTGEEGGR